MNSTNSVDIEPPTRSGAWIPWLWFLLPIAAVAGFYLFRASTRDIQLVPPRIIGDVFTAAVDGATRVYYVTREDRAEARSFDIEGSYTYEHSYSIYTLHSRQALDGNPSAESRLSRIETTSADFAKYRSFKTLPDGPGILGPQSDVLWLWNDGLEARSLKTLEPVWSDKLLRERNRDLASLLPDDPKYAKVLLPIDALVFKARDARYLRVDRATGSFEPVDEAALAATSGEPTKTADSAFASRGPAGKSLRSAPVSGFVWNSFLDDGAWYALLSAEQRAGLTPRLGSYESWFCRGSSIKESSSLLYRGSYALARDANLPTSSIQLATESVREVSPQRFLSAGFLRRPDTLDEAWTLRANRSAEQPTRSALESVIVLHRLEIGGKAPWQLTRIGVDGKTHWSRSTHLTEIEHLNDGRGSIVITGFGGTDPHRGEPPSWMLFLDERRGDARLLNVATGELSTME